MGTSTKSKNQKIGNNMEQNEINLILASIKTDDEKAFKMLIEKHRAYNICFGRFPLLTVLYLYGSKSIIKKKTAQNNCAVFCFL